MKKDRLPEKLQTNTKLSSNSLKISQKYLSIKVFQLYDTSGKWRDVIRYFAFSSSLSIFEDTFAVLPLAFSMLNFLVQP